ncbi:MAG: hypothetical protein R3B47_20000 [Bacteroidia bacterium]
MLERYETLRTVDGCVEAIADMWVRGAPLIGVTAAFGMAFAAREAGAMTFGLFPVTGKPTGELPPDGSEPAVGD